MTARGNTSPALPEALLDTLYHCSDCSYCVDAVWPERGIDHVCATLEHHAPLVSYSGRGYIAAARAWHEGAALDLDTLAERVFSCTTCGNCEVVCPIGLAPATVARSLRTALLAHGHAPAAVTDQLAALGGDADPGRQRARRAWSEGLDVPPEGEVLYFPGCAAANARPAEAAAAWRLIQASGVQVTTLGEHDSCCGAPQREFGACDAADAMHAGVTAKIAARGAGTCVASGAECLHAWQNEATKPVSFLAWLDAALEAGTLRLAPKAGVPKTVAVFDSCQQRAGEEGTRLRALLGTLGVNVTHGATAARYVVCCGAGGGMPQMLPDASRRMANARVQALAEASCEAVIGLDLRCLAHVTADSPLPVYGLAEFLDTYFRVSP